MQRRSLLKTLTAGAVAAGAGFRIPLLHAAEAGSYDGKLFVFVQAEGGWDPTSFCDPKPNPGPDWSINHWTERGEVGQAGNLSYAPFGANAAFFQKYFDRTLIINGVDAQTNSHTAGVVHNWSGRISEGFPSLGALLSGHYADGLLMPMPYINFGGFSNTAGISRFTRLDNADLVINLSYPNRRGASNEDLYMDAADFERMKRYQGMRVGDLLRDDVGAMPRAQRNRDFFQSAMASIDGLRNFADQIPPEDQIERTEVLLGGQRSNLKAQAQLAVLAFKAGVSMSADLVIGGFDTHAEHDTRHEPLMAAMTDGIDWLWDYAEVHGVADRLVLVLTSDFGRTNHYNEGDGKDHWPISSVMVQEKNTNWGNRVVGRTDCYHNAIPLFPSTLDESPAHGDCPEDPYDRPDIPEGATHIYPKHVHAALRDYFGVGDQPITTAFPLGQPEFDFFG